MKIGVLGTGMVGGAIARKLVSLDHAVMMGSRTPNNTKAQDWARSIAGRGRIGTFAETAAFADLVFNCTNGQAALEALHAAGADHLAGKIVVDVANVLPPGAPGSLSLGERIQAAFPAARVVKTLNTVNCEIMVDPGSLPGSHTLFLSGDDQDAKTTVRGILESFGWTDVLDLGDITTARATESYLPLWLALWKSLGSASFNIHVAR